MKDKRWLNIIILTTLLFLSSIWIASHLNTSKTYLFIAAGIPIYLQILNWFISALGIEDKSFVKKLMKQFVSLLIKREVIISLTVLLLIIGLFVSSVTIIAKNTDSEYSIEVLSDKEQVTDSPENRFYKTFQKLLLTSPFGSTYYINIPGYHLESFKLRPVIGHKMEIPKSFRPLPSLLFRLIGPQDLYTNDTLFVIQEKDTLLKMAHEPNKLSFQVGRTETINEELKEIWNTYLTSKGVDEATKSRLILGWSSPVLPEKLLVLNPDDSLLVFIRNHTGAIKGKASIKIDGGAKIQDPLLK